MSFSADVIVPGSIKGQWNIGEGRKHGVPITKRNGRNSGLKLATNLSRYILFLLTLKEILTAIRSAELSLEHDRGMIKET